MDDLLLIPEGDRFHEVLEGEVLRKASPRGEHGFSQSNLAMRLRDYQRQFRPGSRVGGWWFATEATIELSRHVVVQPDVSGWRRERMARRPAGYPIQLRPDWVCEIISDGDARRRDGVQKLRIYAEHDVPHYWLLDTERETLTVMVLRQGRYEELCTATKADKLRAPPFDLVELHVGILFGEEDNEGEEGDA